MTLITMTTTQRNQVTIPAEVRRLLGLHPRDKVAFTIDGDGTVRIGAVPYSLESAYGAVSPRERPEDFDEISRRVKEAKAEKTLREMREG